MNAAMEYIERVLYGSGLRLCPTRAHDGLPPLVIGQKDVGIPTPGSIVVISNSRIFGTPLLARHFATWAVQLNQRCSVDELRSLSDCLLGIASSSTATTLRLTFTLDSKSVSGSTTLRTSFESFVQSGGAGECDACSNMWLFLSTAGSDRHVCLGRFRLSQCVFHSEQFVEVELSPQPTLQFASVLAKMQRARRVPAYCNALLPKLPPSTLEQLSACVLHAAKKLHERLRPPSPRRCAKRKR